MLNLTDKQKTFILDNFFRPNNKDYGCSNIAKALLEDGNCIIAGNSSPWIDEIGNFITVEELANYYSCVKLIFNLESFLSSDYYKEHKNNCLNKFIEEKEELETLIKEVSDL